MCLVPHTHVFPMLSHALRPASTSTAPSLFILCVFCFQDLLGVADEAPPEHVAHGRRSRPGSRGQGQKQAPGPARLRAGKMRAVRPAKDSYAAMYKGEPKAMQTPKLAPSPQPRAGAPRPGMAAVELPVEAWEDATPAYVRAARMQGQGRPRDHPSPAHSHQATPAHGRNGHNHQQPSPSHHYNSSDRCCARA